MLNIRWYCIAIIFYQSSLESTFGQNIGSNCTLEVSRSPGKCKSITKCKKIRDELVKYNRLPQACGFEGTETIVCCPNDSGNPGDISKEKCQEYSLRKNRHKIVKRVVNGEKATRNEFPHMALLGGEKKPGEIHWICGGTIISEKYVLTAAQCLNGFYVVKFIRVGFTNVYDRDHGQEIKVLKTITHPNHENQIAYNDVGLVKLEKPIEFNSYASPACLFTTFQIPDKQAIVTGWGAKNYFSSTRIDLFKATLELADYQFCNSEYKKIVDPGRLGRGIVDEEQICARTDKTVDTCEGDAGGPLQIYDSDLGMYKVIGVISIGSSRCNGKLPTVCTRVSHYIKWIEDIVWPDL